MSMRNLIIDRILISGIDLRDYETTEQDIYYMSDENLMLIFEEIIVDEVRSKA